MIAGSAWHRHLSARGGYEFPVPASHMISPSVPNQIADYVRYVSVFAIFHRWLQSPGQAGPPGKTRFYLPFPDVLDPLFAATDCARAAKEPFATVPPVERAVAPWMRAAADGVIGVRALELDLAMGISFRRVLMRRRSWLRNSKGTSAY